MGTASHINDFIMQGLENLQLLSSSTKFLVLRNPEVSLWCSQKPIIGSCSEGVEPSLHLHIAFFGGHCILSTRLHVAVPCGLFPCRVQTRILYALLICVMCTSCSLHCMCLVFITLIMLDERRVKIVRLWLCTFIFLLLLPLYYS
jgi:hypothetical protein